MKYFQKFNKAIHSTLCPKCKFKIMEMDEYFSHASSEKSYNTKNITIKSKLLYDFFNFKDFKYSRFDKYVNMSKQYRAKQPPTFNVALSDFNTINSNKQIPFNQYVTDFSCSNCGYYKAVIFYDGLTKEKIK
jgi:C4-type Zn-finger protein